MYHFLDACILVHSRAGQNSNAHNYANKHMGFVYIQKLPAYLSQSVIDSNSPNQFKNLLDRHYSNIIYGLKMGITTLLCV